MASRSRARFRAGGRRLSATARAIQAMRASGRNGLLSPLPTQEGFAFQDTGLQIPLVYPYNLEGQARAVIPANAVPPGVRPWSLGANLWDDTAATVSGESQILGGGRYRIYSSTGTNSFVRLNGVIQANKAYLVTFFVESVAVAGAGLRFMDAGTNVPASTGWKTAFLSASSNNPFTHAFIKRDAGATDIVIRNITLQEVVYDFGWLGPNLFNGGDFEAGTASVSQIRCTAAQSNAQVRSGTQSLLCTVNDGSAASRVERALLTINKTYLVEAWVYLPSGQSITGLRIAQAGVVTSVFGEAAQTSVTNTWVKLRAVVGAFVTTIGVSTTSAGSVGNIWYVDDITVQEIPVGVMIAPTAGGKRMSGRVNLLQRTLWTGAVAGASWSPPTGWTTVVSTGSIASPVEGQIDFISNSTSAVIGQTVTLAANTSYDFSVNVVSNTIVQASDILIALTLPAGATGTYFVNGSAVPSTNVVPSGVRLTYRVVVGSTGGSVTMRVGNGCLGATSASTVSLSQPDCRLSIYTGSAYSAYQRVNDGTAGVFDYDHAGFPVMTQIPAAGAGLYSVGLLDLTATDALRIGTVAAKLSDTVSVMAELSVNANTTNGTAYLVCSTAGWQVSSRGTSQSVTAGTGMGGVRVDALNADFDISSDQLRLTATGVLHINGTGDQGTGNYGAHRYYDGGRATDGTAVLPATNVRQVGWFADIADANAIDPETWAGMLRERAAVVGLTF